MKDLYRLSTGGGDDTMSLRRERVNALLERALRGDQDARRSCEAQLSNAPLDGARSPLDERATAATLTEAQLSHLLRTSPRHKTLVTAAREGCVRARVACAALVNDALGYS